MKNPSYLYKDSAKPYWHCSITELYQQLASSSQGLSNSEVSFRFKKQNQIAKPSSVINQSFSLLWKQLKNPLLLLLFFTCAVSLTVGDFAEALIMGAIILGSLLLSFIQEFRANLANERLQKNLALYSTVLRSNKPISILSSNIVPGDIVLVTAGNLIPADGIIISCEDLFVNEAVLTGESLAAEKHVGISDIDAPIISRRNCLYMGTSVRSGSAKLLIIHTESATEFGAIAATLQFPSDISKFEQGLRELGLLLSRVMLVFLSLVLLANVIMDRPFLETMLFALAIAVGISPQLLPAILSTMLSRGSQSMAKEGVLVKHLTAIENLGLMDVLCTDKTGTLTTGSMSVKNIIDMEEKSSSTLKLYAYLNASMQLGISNPLDDAIISYGKTFMIDSSRFDKIDELPFDFFRKRLTIIVREHGTGSDLMICKGALEKVLDICDFVAEKNQITPLSSILKHKILSSCKSMADQGIRALGLALKKEAPRQLYTLKDEHSFVFQGFILTSDELRPETIETLKDLAQLGVSLRMITGDNQFVAKNIAKQIGLDDENCLTGPEINRMSDEALWHKVETTQIFSEVDPQQKARIVSALKQIKHTVGFLGDGINDAAALQIADVGISVQTAVDVARESADIILIKSGLDVLKRGIIIGRTIFANTNKYILITSSANFGNMISMAFASLFLPFLPLLPVQVLLNNFLTDFPSLLIGTDKVDADQLHSYQKWDFALIKKYMFIFGGLSSLIDGLTFLVILFVFRSTPESFRSAWFIVCVLTELLVIFIIRTTKPFYASSPSLSLMISCLIVAVLTLFLPYTAFGDLFGFIKLAPFEVFILTCIAIVFFITGELLKFLIFGKPTKTKTFPTKSKPLSNLVKKSLA